MSRYRAPLFLAALAGLCSRPAIAAAPPDSGADAPAAADSGDAPDSAPGDDAATEGEDTEPSTSEASAADASEDTSVDPQSASDETPEPAADDASDDEVEPSLDAGSELSPGVDPTSAATAGDEDPPPLPNPLPPKHRISYNNLTVARLNPLGLINRLLIEYRYRLYDEPSLLKNGSYIGVGVETQLSPGLATVRPQIQIQPLAVLKLRAGYGLFTHFGTFDLNSSFESPLDEHYAAEIAARGPDEAYANIGGQGVFGALVQAKVWQIAIRNDLNFFVSNMQLKDGDNVWYSQLDDMMLEGDGWHLTNDSDVLWLSDFGLTVGVRNTITKAFYNDSSFRPGELAIVERDGDPNGPTNRVGPLVAYTFYDDPREHPRFNRPSILVISQWWTNHRYRTGALLDDPYNRESITVNSETGEREEVGSIGDGLPAMPYLVIGFAFEGDLFQFDKGQTVPMEGWKERWKARRAARKQKRQNKRDN